MSGLIGSIGSKSGVISHIEQDFEPWTSKTWTYGAGFSGAGNGGGATYAGGYARIGKLVYINGHFSGTSNSTELYINNLPYKANTIGNNIHGIAVGNATNNGAGAGTANAYINENATTMYFTLNGNWQGWTNSGTKGAIFGGWYLID